MAGGALPVATATATPIATATPVPVAATPVAGVAPIPNMPAASVPASSYTLSQAYAKSQSLPFKKHADVTGCYKYDCGVSCFAGGSDECCLWGACLFFIIPFPFFCFTRNACGSDQTPMSNFWIGGKHGENRLVVVDDEHLLFYNICCPNAPQCTHTRCCNGAKVEATA